MSRYRWLRPLKCLETMDFFPETKDQSYEAMQKLLFDAVARGDIRAMFNEVIVPKAHIGAYLACYSELSQGQEPNILPPNFDLSYDDLCAVFDRPVIDNRKRGRPTKEHSGWSEDRKLTFEMHRMLANGQSVPRATSATEAARILVNEGRVSGAGTPENRAKRLVRKFRKYYSS